MPQLLETRMFRLNWGNAHSSEQKGKTGESGIIEARQDELDASMARVLAEINDGGWEIKASLPLSASEFSTQVVQPQRNAAGYVTSFAAPFTDGVVLLCQRHREMSEESYAAIMAERDSRQEKLLRDRREAFLAANPISEKRKLIGANSFQFRGKDYPTREAAESAQALALSNL
jgi:hypothetical protein